MKCGEVHQTAVRGVKSAKVTQKNSNRQRCEIAHWIVLHRLPNGICSDFADFRLQIKYLGWVGLEPTTNALKGRYYILTKCLL
jgi:hypothetical protein